MTEVKNNKLIPDENKNSNKAFWTGAITYLRSQCSDFHALKSTAILKNNQHWRFDFYFSKAIQLNFQMFGFKAPLHRVSEKKGKFDGQPTAGQVDRSVLSMPDKR